jgi:hypothetical protein
MHWWVYPLAAWFLAAYCVTLNWQLRRLCDPTHTANRVWHRSAWHKVGLVAACALMFLPMLALWWVLLEPWRSNDPDALAGSYELHESGLRRISTLFVLALVIFIIMELVGFHWSDVLDIGAALAVTLLIGVNHVIKLDKISEKLGELPLNQRQAAYNAYVRKLGGSAERAQDARGNFGLPG